MKVTKNLLFYAATKVTNLRFHKYLWSVMGMQYDTHVKFKDLVMKVNENGHNVFQLAVIHNRIEIIKWIWNKIDRDVFNDRELKKFLLTPSSGEEKSNILQLAATHNVDKSVHEWLWESVSRLYGRDTLKELLEYADVNERNVFHLAAMHNSNEVFMRLYAMAKEHVGPVEMRKLLRKKEVVYDENVFDIAKKHAKDVNIHTWLKTKRHKYF